MERHSATNFEALLLSSCDLAGTSGEAGRAAVASARALAKVGAMMAAGGSRLLSEATLDVAHGGAVTRFDDLLLRYTRITTGGFAEYR